MRPQEVVRSPMQQTHEVPVSAIRENPMQPRKSFHHAEQEELIASIKRHGILQPLIISPSSEPGKYDLIAGERRLRSARILGLKAVPVVVRDSTEQEKLELSIIENVQRKNLNPVEEAHGYRRLLDEFNLTQEDVAKRVSKSRAHVTNILRILQLPEEIQKALREEVISFGHAKTLLSLREEKEQYKAFRSIVAGHLSVRETEANVHVAKKGPKGREALLLRDLADRLTRHLGTKVGISKSGQTGKISISFYSVEELSSIVNIIMKK